MTSDEKEINDFFTKMMLTPGEELKHNLGQSLMHRRQHPLERLQALVARVTYKPGWTFKLYQSNGDDQSIRDRYFLPYTLLITQQVKDVNRPETTIMLSFAAFIDQDSAAAMPNDIFISEFVYKTIRDFELHEMDEWFKLDGKCVREPQH